MTRISRILLTAAFLYAGVVVAAAHQMTIEGPAISYPNACCSNRDCMAVPAGAVEFTPTGWLIHSNMETIAEELVRHSPDRRWHICFRGGNPARAVVIEYTTQRPCIWAPGGDF